MRKAGRKQRAKKAAAKGVTLGRTCPTCGLPRRGHLLCGACGVLAGVAGSGHASLGREPFGDHEICAGCWRHLARRRLRVGLPWRQGGRAGTLEPIDRPGPAWWLSQRPT